jgi:putative SOS response-associated peptidase YedK
MCTLYRIRNSHAEIARIFRASAASLPNTPTPDVYPDRTAPVVRNKNGTREVMAMATDVSSLLLEITEIVPPIEAGFAKPRTFSSRCARISA